MNTLTDSDMELLAGFLITIPILATPIALLASFGLLRFYRRAVLKSMDATADSGPTGLASSDSAAPLRTDRAEIEPPVLDCDPATTIGTPAEALFSESLRAPWRAAAIYAVAGFCFALTMAIVWFVDSGTPEVPPLHPTRFLFWVWTFSWPVVISLYLVAAPTRRLKVVLVSSYFLIPVLLLILGRIIPEYKDQALSWQLLLWLLAITFVPTAMLWAVINRRIRAVGPLVLAFVVIVIAGVMLTFFVGGRDEWLTGDEARSMGVPQWAIEGYANGNEALFYLIIALIVIGRFIGLALLVAVPIGVLAVWWIRRRYERKKISDQSVTLDSIWLLFGFVYSALLFSVGYELWNLLSGFLAFAAYKAAAWAGFRLRGREPNVAESPRLLLLRVFSLGRRSERLFDAVAKRWRHIGSIRMIAGPDLATTTVEPHEFLDFLTRKLARRFIDGPQTLERRIRETHLKPDRDGRFRVNDFFCFKDTWQMVLSRLVNDSDAVLMDLRGFSSENQGVIHEIRELVNTVPLERVVFVVDDTTDERFLNQTFEDSLKEMPPTSPNLSATVDQVNLFRLAGSYRDGVEELLRALCEAATSIPPTDRQTAVPV